MIADRAWYPGQMPTLESQVLADIKMSSEHMSRKDLFAIRNQVHAQVRATRMRERLRAIKLERGCEDCRRPGLPARVLHFHHRDPAAKSFDIPKNVTRAWSLVEAEIAKCDVLCAGCHAFRHSAP